MRLTVGASAPRGNSGVISATAVLTARVALSVSTLRLKLIVVAEMPSLIDDMT